MNGGRAPGSARPPFRQIPGKEVISIMRGFRITVRWTPRSISITLEPY